MERDKQKESSSIHTHAHAGAHIHAHAHARALTHTRARSPTRKLCAQAGRLAVVALPGSGGSAVAFGGRLGGDMVLAQVCARTSYSVCTE